MSLHQLTSSGFPLSSTTYNQFILHSPKYCWTETSTPWVHLPPVLPWRHTRRPACSRPPPAPTCSPTHLSGAPWECLWCPLQHMQHDPEVFNINRLGWLQWSKEWQIYLFRIVFSFLNYFCGLGHYQKWLEVIITRIMTCFLCWLLCCLLCWLLCWLLTTCTFKSGEWNFFSSVQRNTLFSNCLYKGTFNLVFICTYINNTFDKRRVIYGSRVGTFLPNKTGVPAVVTNIFLPLLEPLCVNQIPECT